MGGLAPKALDTAESNSIRGQGPRILTPEGSPERQSARSRRRFAGPGDLYIYIYIYIYICMYVYMYTVKYIYIYISHKQVNNRVLM